MLFGAGCSNVALVAQTPNPTEMKPSPSETPPMTAAFDVPATFVIGQTILFQEGISLQLTAINDSRCKPDVQCIWAGERSSRFIFRDADRSSQAFTLGTVREPRVTLKGRVISLKDATADHVTITVSEK